MKIDNTSRLASIILAVLFMSNDLVASIHFMVTQPLWEQAYMQNSSYPMALPASDAPADDEWIAPAQHEPKASSTAQTTEPVMADVPAGALQVLADHQTAYLGAHENDKMGNPADDIFTIDITEPVEAFHYAVLHYQVKGLADGQNLPKTINSQATYGATEIAADENWQDINQTIDIADLQSGNNYISFALPQTARLAVEVKDVGLSLTNRQPMAQPAAKMARMEANPLFLSIKTAEKTSAMYAFALHDFQMVAIPRSIANVTMGASGYHIQTPTQGPVTIEVAVDPAKMLGTSNIKEVKLFFLNKLSKRWESIIPENVDLASLTIEATVPGNNDYFAGMIKTPEMPEAAAFMPTTISDIEAANPAAGMNLMSPPDVSHTGEASIHYPLDIPQGRQGMTPQLAITYNSDAGTGWVWVGTYQSHK